MFLSLRRPLSRLATIGLLGVCTGCGNVFYAFQINSAAGRFEEAKTLGAEETAPYEYYSAEVRLMEAKRLAARAEYGTAADLAEAAERYAEKAVRLARREKAKAPE